MDGAFKGCWRNAGHLRQSILSEGWKWNFKKEIWCCTHILLTSCFHVLIPRNTSILKTYWISLRLFESARALFAWQTLQNLKRNNTAVFLCDTRHYSSIFCWQNKRAGCLDGNMKMSKYERLSFSLIICLLWKLLFFSSEKTKETTMKQKCFGQTLQPMFLLSSPYGHTTPIYENHKKQTGEVA